MNNQKIFEIIGGKHLDTQTQQKVNEVIKVLIESPRNTRALDTLINLIGADKLDHDTEQRVRENLQNVIDLAARELLSTLSEREKIKRQYTKQSEMLVEGDEAIAAYHRAVKSVLKENFKWDRGMHSDPIKSSTDKVSKDNWKWFKDNEYAYTPMSGREYHANTKRGEK